MRISDQEYNRLTVLKHLRAAEPASRTDLVHLSGLTGGSITAITADLVKRGLVIEEKVEVTGPGRPRVNLRIDPDGAYAVAASMTMVGGLRVSVVNLRGETVWSAEVDAAHDGKLDSLARTVAQQLELAIVRSGARRERIARAGIALPALIDNRTGTVLSFQTFDAGPFPFAARVEEQIGIPVSVDNDINLMAKAMHWFGGGTGINDFTLLVVDLGIGSARYQDGELLCGSHGIGAELAHTKIVPDGGEACHCGAHGCLQAYASISGLLRRWSGKTYDPSTSLPAMREDFAAMIGAARSGDAEALEAVQLAGRYLGIAIANHVNMQDPDDVVVMTLDEDFAALLAPPMLAAVEEGTMPALKGRTNVHFEKLSRDLLSQGAAALVLEKLYQSR